MRPANAFVREVVRDRQAPVATQVHPIPEMQRLFSVRRRFAAIAQPAVAHAASALAKPYAAAAVAAAAKPSAAHAASALAKPYAAAAVAAAVIAALYLHADERHPFVGRCRRRLPGGGPPVGERAVRRAKRAAAHRCG